MPSKQPAASSTPAFQWLSRDAAVIEIPGHRITLLSEPSASSRMTPIPGPHWYVFEGAGLIGVIARPEAETDAALWPRIARVCPEQWFAR